MESYFAPPQRLEGPELKPGIENVCRNPVVKSLLYTVEGSIAVLNEHRQILALNNEYLEFLGIDDAHAVLGLRPGEAVHCVHAAEEPGGCGTSRFCSTCGAAVAIVSSLGMDQAVEKHCCLNVKDENGEEKDIFLSVRSVPFSSDGQRFLMLFLRDITRQNQWAALERTFIHDISNLVHSLVLTSEMLARKSENGEPARRLHGISRHLAGEIAIQKALLQSEAGIYPIQKQKIPVGSFLQKLADAAQALPCARDKTLAVDEAPRELVLTTDFSLLFRIVHNMVVNALEATPEKGEVRVRTETNGAGVAFCVWSREPIPADIGRRVFQRNFTTKKGTGRGLGTFSMKFFGEKMLDGRVSFESSPEAGTTFRFALPLGG